MTTNVNQQILDTLNKLDTKIKNSIARTESLENKLEKKIAKEYEQRFIQYKKTHSDEDLVNFLNIKRIRYLFEQNKVTFSTGSKFNINEILKGNEE